MTAPSDLLPGTRSVPFALALAAHGDRTAVIAADGPVTYRELAARVDATARRLGRERRLILLVGANTLDALVVHLAALASGHPLLLVPGDHPDAVQSLIDAYDPDVVARPDSREWVLDERRPVSAHVLHPDLALLLSTSGSTGSPKLVRLSHENLQSNAESIAEYLGIRDTDRAATTLPMHYCYGLSVIHSHLLRGATVILTDLSVADTCFWELFRSCRGTTFAGVPYTFDLLDRVGFDTMELPHLRYVTQAGGRLAPALVQRYAALGRASGWELFVMYGQTEATARMAYLPPELAATRPEAAGVAIPGGSFRLHPLPEWPEEDTGELVYAGPNVMLGYAHTPQDLGLGRTVKELATGDIARLTPDGLHEIVGRRSRFVKILGLRIDPDQVEAMLTRHGITALCAGDDEALAVAATSARASEAGRIQKLVTSECGLPARAVRVRIVTELPRLASGKPDYRAVRELGRPADTAAPGPGPAGGMDPEDLCALYALILDQPRREVTQASTFVSLGGDSLSYVEMSLHLEERLGHLPAAWHTTPIRELRPPERKAPSYRRALETSVALRAVAIFCVIGSHIQVFGIKGGAHLLLALAGYNFARFHLTTADRRERVRRIWVSIGRVALPSMAWISFVLLLNDDYTLANLALLDSVFGPEDSKTGMHFWFIEALVYILIAAVAVLALPLADRWERRFPYGLPLTIAAVGLLPRYDLLGLPDRTQIPDAITVFWLFALGWAAAKAGTARRRLLVTAAALATVPGFFPGDPGREAIIVAGFALLVWVPTLPSRERVNQLAGLMASSSLYIYLTHWQIFPLIEGFSRHLAFLASLVFGIAYATCVTRLMRGLPVNPLPSLRRSPAGRHTSDRSRA
ncbi:AMP-binding protein [Streptomyces lunaelactis]|uniref:AMP-binding protein n=1 Tax=Streptomyces lunaelactis TaxID=1535768 RepID=UPI0015857AD6|nr:AMP-binding protein [Streptomyces lunaelactis]NUK32479.1 AMP-binding protein [Streptomyces lunaelactis]NUK39496.1 AMP-binding protein [Streptomyces lunaelactis]NUK90803.1 AMP-binding protein [Streptomyces lunaelactis]NUL29030.1 AMP-binding protein [Streptomyces lunaelactis]